MFKKKKAFSDMLVCIITLLVMLLVLRYAISVYQTLDNGRKKESIAREYMLAMESKGYLTLADQAALIDDLTVLGVTELNFSGTTLAPVGYGQPVVLSVTGKIKSEKITGMNSDWSFMREDEYDFKIYYKSTAKY